MKTGRFMSLCILQFCFLMCLVEGIGARGLDKRDAISWTEDFDIEGCQFSSTGRNRFFILEPGYQLHFSGYDQEDTVELVITVLNETVTVGNVETRVVEEREMVNGDLIEISRNFFALCMQSNSMFYFGEDVNMYEAGKVVSHEGAWRADGDDAKAGIMMPGVVLLGARYYQEIAPGTAMDRAEIISMHESLETPAGAFDNCLKIEETTPLEPDEKEYKLYAPGIGLIKDGNLLLMKYGFVKDSEER
jgi:hypothetical protein